MYTQRELTVALVYGKLEDGTEVTPEEVRVLDHIRLGGAVHLGFFTKQHDRFRYAPWDMAVKEDPSVLISNAYISPECNIYIQDFGVVDFCLTDEGVVFDKGDLKSAYALYTDCVKYERLCELLHLVVDNKLPTLHTPDELNKLIRTTVNQNGEK